MACGKQWILAAALGSGVWLAGSPAGAEPMLGYWQSRTGLIASVASCGGALCITLRNREFAGRTIGKMSGSNGNYSGSILHPGWNWTFNGYAKLNGDTVRISGCVVGQAFCRTQVWRRLRSRSVAER
ncbi:MAG: DUF2147 domain-containing protein [Beijerinckiaceae bacterium]